MTDARRTQMLVAAVIGAVAVAVSLGAWAGHVLRPLEEQTVNARFDLRGSKTPSDVVVVDIDDYTYDALGEQWPYPRCLHADVINRIAKGHPSAIAVDIQFTEPSPRPACDQRLVNAVQDAGHVVLSTTEVDKNGSTKIFGGGDVLSRLGARPGNTVFPGDHDGVLRHAPYVFRKLTGFGVVAAEVASGHTIARPGTDRPWIDFAGTGGTVTTYPYADVLRGHVPPSAFKDKVVVIGVSYAASGDRHRTSVGTLSGPEIEANVANTALHGFPLRSAWNGLMFLLVVLFAFLAPVARLWLRAWQALLVGLGAAVLFLVVAQVAFDLGRVLAVVYPLLALAVSCIGVLVAEVTADYARREHRHRMRTAQQTRLLISGWIAGVAIGITLLAYFGGLMRSFEEKSVDARFGLRGSQGPPQDVVIVEIEDDTFTALNQQWPFSRCTHARLINQIAKARPSAIAVDIQFTEPTYDADRAGVPCDLRLVNAVQKAAYDPLPVPLHTGLGDYLVEHPRAVLSTTEVAEDGTNRILGGGDILPSILAIPGNTVIPNDSDGVMRHVPYSTQGLTSFGIATAEIVKGETIPPPGTRNIWIDYAGPPDTMTHYEYTKVLRGKVPASVFAGKVVVIGPAATSLQDYHSTPTSGSSQMPGAEVQANVIETALRGFPLRSVWFGWNFVLIAAFGLLAPLVSLRLKGWRAPALALGVGALFAVAVQLAFNNGRVVTFTYPLLALGLSAIGVLVAEYLIEAFERVRTHDTFSRFVPEAVVNQVLERTGGELRLGGELVEGTAMFTDLRGFTTFSEGLPADEVIGLLNGYLGEISDAVLAHGGTLVSYLGDGLMAVFGAPLPQDDHADRALAAAREMLEVRLPQYNEVLRAQGFERGFKMGIGLNSGPFMSGNVGSQRRLEYTAIGDTINTASRIEGMTKGTPYALYLADSVKEALQTPVDDLVYIDEMPVRGRTHPIRLWSIDADYVQKENWESEVAKPEPTPPAGAEEPVPAST